MIWLTGLPGSGKTTIGTALCDRLARAGRPARLLDGDEIRRSTPQLGYSREERLAHLARVAEMAANLERDGHVAVVAVISPYREARDAARAACRRFIETHVATSLAECERRDPRGLYRAARAGQLRDFTGVSAPYEVPVAPDVRVEGGTPVAMAVDRILAALDGPEAEA